MSESVLDLARRYDALANLLDQCEGDADLALVATPALERLGSSLQERVTGVLALIRDEENRAEQQKSYIKDLQGLKKTSENRREKLRWLLRETLALSGVKTVRSAIGTVTLREPALTVDIHDPEECVKAGFGTATVTLKVEGLPYEDVHILVSIIDTELAHLDAEPEVQYHPDRKRLLATPHAVPATAATFWEQSSIAVRLGGAQGSGGEDDHV